MVRCFPILNARNPSPFFWLNAHWRRTEGHCYGIVGFYQEPSFLYIFSYWLHELPRFFVYHFLMKKEGAYRGNLVCIIVEPSLQNEDEFLVLPPYSFCLPDNLVSEWPWFLQVRESILVQSGLEILFDDLSNRFVVFLSSIMSSPFSSGSNILLCVVEPLNICSSSRFAFEISFSVTYSVSLRIGPYKTQCRALTSPVAILTAVLGPLVCLLMVALLSLEMAYPWWPRIFPRRASRCSCWKAYTIWIYLLRERLRN